MAMTRSRPPQRGQARTSKSNTRRTRAAQAHAAGGPAAREVLDFADGTGDALVRTVRLHASGAAPPAVGPPRVEIRMRTEDAAGLALALKAG